MLQTTRTIRYKLLAEKGDKGDTGERGPALRGPQYWVDKAVGFEFQSGASGEDYLDVVIYNSAYYKCIRTHTKATPLAPGTVMGQLYWRAADTVEIIAAGILLAKDAYIEHLISAGIVMMDADGNVVFSARNGDLTCKTGTFNNVTVNGYFKSEFVNLEDSDAVKSEATEYNDCYTYTVNTNVNLRRNITNDTTSLYACTPNIKLPSDKTYIGTHVLIYDTFKPSSRNHDPGKIYTEDGSPILGYSSTSDLESVTTIKALVCAYGIVEFLGLPSDDGTSTIWCITRMNMAYVVPFTS